MDPKANLDEQADLAQQLLDLADAQTDEADTESARAALHEMARLGTELAELVVAYAAWRQRGGYA